MTVKRSRYWLLNIVVFLLLGFCAVALEQYASEQQSGNLLQRAQVLDGAYNVEQSDTLPGAQGPLRRMYRWTQPESRITLWPSLPRRGLLSMEYLAPEAGLVLLRFDDRASIALEPSAGLRRLHALIPPVSEQVFMTQSASITNSGRPLGFIISDVSWRGFRAEQGVFAINRRGLHGIPLTVGLLVCLGIVLGWRWQWWLLTGAAVAVLGVGVAQSAWLTRAVQPLLHGLLGWAVLGVALFALARRFHPQRWQRWIIGAWLISLLLYFTPVISHDGTEYYAYLRSLLIDGDLRFNNDLDPAQSPFAGTPNLAATPTETGYTPNLATVGPAIVWAPFWLIAHGITYLGRAWGTGWQVNGYAPPYIVLVGLASAMAGLLTALGCYALARRWFTERVAALAAVTLYGGSNLLYYAQFQGSFAHSLSAATATWFVIAVLAVDDQPTLRRWAALGAAGGAMILMYWIAALLLIMPGLVFVRQLWSALRRRDRFEMMQLGLGALLAAVVALLVFSPQLLVWKIIYGDWLAIPHGGNYITPRSIKLGQVLFSPLYGVAWWTPAYFVGMLGSVWFALRRPWPGVVLLAGVAIYVLYNASLQRWFAGGSFGMRRFTVLAPMLGVGLAAVIHAARRYPRAMIALAAAIIGWSMAMTLRYVVFAISHDTDVLGNIDLPTLTLTMEPWPFGALRQVTLNSLFGRSLLFPSPGSTILLVALVSACLIAWLAWRFLANKRSSPKAAQNVMRV